MKRERIRIPNLPASIIKQPNNIYRCCKTLRWYSLSTLQRMFGTEPETHPKQEVEHWTKNYYGNS